MAWATKYPLTIKDCRGKSITIPREPRRIVSTVPSNTEILFALGLDNQIVGVGVWDDYPLAAKKKPKVGDRTISLERLITLKPDLVVAHGNLNSDVIPSIEKYGITVVAIDPKTISQVESDIALIGRVTNREKNASAINKKLADAKSFVQRKAAGMKSKPKVLVAVQGEPLWAAGPNTFIDEMIALAGGVNIASDVKPGFSQFSSEAAVWRHPDIIIGTDKGDKKIFTNGLWKNTNAARTGKVYEVDPNLLVRPGPRLAEGMLMMERLIHP